MNTVFPNISDYDPATGGVKPPEPAEPVAQPSRWAKLRGWLAGWAAWPAKVVKEPGVVALIGIVILVQALPYLLFWGQSAESVAVVPADSSACEPILLDLDRRILALENLAQAQASAPPIPTAPPARSSSSRAPVAAPPRQSPPQQAQPAEPPASTWGQTALDRAIADFKPATAFGATP